MQGQLKNVQQIQATYGAFAALLGGGSVVTWGAESGGDSSSVQGQLKDVQQIQACHYAFAAILGDGSVVSWGDAGRGGDSSAVQHKLKNVLKIQASEGAFAAVLADGSAVTWGGVGYGGNSKFCAGSAEECAGHSGVGKRFCCYSCRCLRRDLGLCGFVLNSRALQAPLKHVQRVQSSGNAFGCPS